MSNIRDFNGNFTPAFDGEHVKLDDILNEPLIVDDFVELQSKYREDTTYATVHARLLNQNQKKFFFFTGSHVILKQLKTKGLHGLPFKAKIVQPETKRYYTFKRIDTTEPAATQQSLPQATTTPELLDAFPPEQKQQLLRWLSHEQKTQG